jgi:hypothetical protein
VRGLFSSARARRRFAWLGGLLLGAGIVTGLVFAFPGPKPQAGAHLSTQKAELVTTERSDAFGPKKREVLKTAMEFVRTAVARHQIGQSWDLVAPSLKQGYSRAEWASGRDLPVVKYPVVFANWRLSYSYKDEVDLQVRLFARSSKTPPAVFDITMKPVRSGGRTRWLVSEFLPTPVDSGINGGPNRTNLFQASGPSAPRTSRLWLLVVVGIFSLLLAVLAGLGFRSWHARRVYRAYAREHF